MAEIGQGGWLACLMAVSYMQNAKGAVEILKPVKGLRLTKGPTHEVSLFQDF